VTGFDDDVRSTVSNVQYYDNVYAYSHCADF